MLLHNNINMTILLLFGLSLVVSFVDCQQNITDFKVYEVNIPLTTDQASSYEHLQNNTEVVAQVRGIASLKCRTQRNPDQLVTWMKRGNEQLLTAGLQVYSSETRYSVSHIRNQKVWELRIRDVKFTDEGTYECQVTTHPPISIFFHLTIVEAKAIISGPKELHVNEGSLVTLHCEVEYATETPLYVFWFHNETMINFQSKRPITVTKQMFSSKLIIRNVTREDAGTFTCEPHLAISDNITLHVLAGETSAAMQRDQSNSDQGTVYAHTSSVSSTHHVITYISCILVIINHIYQYICFL